MKLEFFSETGKAGTFRYYWVHHGKIVSPSFSTEGWARVWYSENMDKLEDPLDVYNDKRLSTLLDEKGWNK